MTTVVTVQRARRNIALSEGFSSQQPPVPACHNMFGTTDLETQFANFAASGEEVFEIDLLLVPRDVHLEKKGGTSRWRVNQKATRRAEVSFRKLEDHDKMDLLRAMKSGLGSYLEKEAVEICSKRDISRERVLPMRWVLIGKAPRTPKAKWSGKSPKPGSSSRDSWTLTFFI